MSLREQRGCSVHRQSWQRMCRYVANLQVDVADVALHGQALNLLRVARVQHHSAQALQRAAANADTTDMLDVVTVTLYEAGTSTHRHHDSFGQPTLETCAQTIGHKFVDLLCRNAIQVLVNVACAYARQHHLLHVAQRYLVVVQILAKGTIE